MSYWDSSALAKLYVPEVDSQTFEHFAASGLGIPVVSRLAILELQTIFRRKEAEGTLNAGASEISCRRLAHDFETGNLRVIEFKDVERVYEAVLSGCFQKSPPVFIRTLDAIHLAAAIVARETEIVATDKRLRDAALALGLKVFP